MRTIKPASSFKRDFKRASAGSEWSALVVELPAVLHMLINDTPLPEKYCDHALSGDWSGYRECHVKPDLLLIYRKDQGVLCLARLGSHSELFG